MSRSRTGQKVTFSIPDELLKLADLQAEVMGLDRYDVVRMAIAQGLLVLRIQYEVTADPETYKKELGALAGGSGLAPHHMADKLESRLVEGVKKQTARKRSEAA